MRVKKKWVCSVVMMFALFCTGTHQTFASGVMDVVIEGDEPLSLQLSMRQERQKEKDTRELAFSTELAYSSATSVDELAAMIKQRDNSFDLSFYKVKVNDRGDGDIIIDFIEMIDGFETLSGYSAIYKNGFLWKIFNNKIPLERRNVVGKEQIGKVSDTIINVARSEALTMIRKDQDVITPKQSNYFYYDLEEGKAYILVKTDFTTQEGFCNAQCFFYEPIDFDATSYFIMNLQRRRAWNCKQSVRSRKHSICRLERYGFMSRWD